MFWTFLIAFGIGSVLIKLGALTALITILSVALKVALFVIVVLIGVTIGVYMSKN